MKMKRQTLFQKKIFTAYAMIAVIMFLLSVMHGLLASDTPIGIQTARAESHLGILGQQAPDLNLNDWIDGDGKKMDPVRLSAYRGKVIYLYFWQDW
ncbi:MAG: hypothetical protein PVI71_11020 [Desulfobacterales bacterium]|jgi:hypothetical protein